MSQTNNRSNQGVPENRPYQSGEGQGYGSGKGISPGRMGAPVNSYAADRSGVGASADGYAQAGGNDAAGGSGRSRRSIAADRMMQGRRVNAGSGGAKNHAGSVQAPSQGKNLAGANARTRGNVPAGGNMAPRGGMPAGGNMATRDSMPAGGNMATRGSMPAGGNMATRGGMPADGNIANRGGNMANRGSMPMDGNMALRGGMPAGGNMAPRGRMPAGENMAPRGGMPAGGNMAPRGRMPAGENMTPRGGMPAGENMTPRGGMPAGGNMAPRGGMPAGGNMAPRGGMPAGGNMAPRGGMPAGGHMTTRGSMPAGGNMADSAGAPVGGTMQYHGDLPASGNAQRRGNNAGASYGQGRESMSGFGNAQRRGGAAGDSDMGNRGTMSGSSYTEGQDSGRGAARDQTGYPYNGAAAVAGGNRSTARNGAAAGRQGTSSSMSAPQAGGGGGYGSGGGRNTASGGRGGQPPRSGAGRQPVRNTKRKRRPPFDGMKIAIVVAGLILVVLCVAGAAKFIGGRQADEAVVTTPSETETQTEAELQKEVTVEGISITGMSREEAKSALMKKYEWGMKVTYEDKERDVKDLMGEKINALLSDIYTGEPKESYALDTSGLDEAIEAEVKAIAAEWDVPAKNGSISSFDKETGAFIYAGEQNGRVIVQDQLAADIKAQLEAKNFKAVIQAKGMDKAPEITEAQAKEMYQVIGTYTTTTTTNKDRNTNIRLASDALNGVILQPGEEFSFNKATGERSQDKGYRPAGAYLNGELIEEPGGGVCQVSSTLYNAVVFAGLTTTERHAHSYEPSYVTPGEDAMVSYGGPDMKFVNSSPSAIAIRASFSDRKLKLSIVGIPILEDGVELSMSSQKTGELDPPAPVYEEDQTIEPGTEKVVIEAKKGSRWVTNLITKKDGVVVSDEFFHNSTYRGKSATIKRNTSGVMIQPETSSQPEESSSAASGETTSSDVQNQTTAPTTEPAKSTEATEGQKGPGVTEPSSQPAQGQPVPSQPSPSQPATQPGGPGDTAGGAKPTAPSAGETVAIPPNPLGL